MLVFVLFALRVLCACSRRWRETEYLAGSVHVRVYKQWAGVRVRLIVTLFKRGDRRERLLVMYLGEETLMSCLFNFNKTFHKQLSEIGTLTS